MVVHLSITVFDPTLVPLPIETSSPMTQNGPISTNDPWLAPGATQTLGNNVDAYVDLGTPDGLTAGTDFRATTTAPSGIFLMSSSAVR